MNAPINAERLRRMAAAAAIPGLCIALVGPERTNVIYAGEDAPGSGRAVGPGTWFQAASTGKHVTACVILDLAAQGRLGLTDPIGAYLPDLAEAWRDRSIAALLRHSSGLPEYLSYADDERPPVTRADFMLRARSLDPISSEAQSWNYSNSNYILLGMLAAEVGGRSCGRLMEDLFERLSVTGARAASPDWVRAANAQGFGEDIFDTDSLDREVIGDGDVAFTGPGATRWLHRLLDAPVIDQLVDRELFAPVRLVDGPAPYGCGWFLDTVGGAALAHHAGHYDGWTAMALLNRSRGCGVLAMCNLAPGSTRAIRALAVAALEDFVPGSTPLALAPIKDERSDLTAVAKRQFLRQGAPVDRDAFAPALQLSIDRAGPVRGILDLWSGEVPAAFELVEHTTDAGKTMRLYRLSYAERIEHLRVRTAADDRISWAWPL